MHLSLHNLSKNNKFFPDIHVHVALNFILLKSTMIYMHAYIYREYYLMTQIQVMSGHDISHMIEEL